MIFLRRCLIATAVAALLGGIAWARAEAQPATDDYMPTMGQDGKDVGWIPTPQILVERMLDMAQLTPQDRLVDLGSGDGRTVITAAKRGIAARGIEFNPDLVEFARRQAQAEGVADRASFEQADIFESDFSDATVVTLFLLPSLNVRLRPILLEMPPGTRIIANSFSMGEWLPDETVQAGEGCLSYCEALKWIVPARIAGTWRMDGKILELMQNFQMLQGWVRDGVSMQSVSDARLEGARVRFSIGDDQYIGEVNGNRMQGTINGSRPWRAVRAGG